MMPRRKPTQVVEMRYALSDFERVQLKEMNENMAKARRLNAVSGAVSSTGVLVVGGGVLAAAVFFGLGYAGMGLRDVMQPVRDWMQGRIDEILTGEQVVYFQEKLDHATARKDYWSSLREDATLYSPAYWAAEVKVRYWEVKIVEYSLKLAASEEQVRAAESGQTETLADIITGQ